MKEAVVACLLVVYFIAQCTGQEPMSPCTQARSTYYNYAGQNNGACQFGALGGARLGGFIHVAAPNEAFWNNSMACGECYEVVGPNGNVTIMVADLCPVQGNPVCDGKIDHFDLGSSSTFGLLADPELGVILETIRKVACPLTGNIGVYFVSGTSQYYVGFVVYNHIVGITKVEMQPTGSGSFYPMSRNSNQWEYNYVSGSQPTVGSSYNIRVTGVTGEQLTIPLTTFAERTSVTSTVQFAAPSPGFGGSSSTPCAVRPPPDIIYDDYIYNGNGANSFAWNDWSYNTNNNPASTNNPYAGTYCFASRLNAYGGIQFGRALPISWSGEFTDLQFAIRADSDYSALEIYWGGNTRVSLSVNTTWQVITLSLASDLDSPSQIGASPATLNIQNNAGATSPTIYIDEMVFLPRNNASFINPGFPPGPSEGSGGGSSASGLQRVPLFVLLLIGFVCIFILL